MVGGCVKVRARLCLTLFLLAAAAASARDKQEEWLKISSQHFTVFTNGSEKQGRRTADQFERMRAVFHAMFPDMHDPPAPIVVIAVKDDNGFRALEPEAFLAKGQLELWGIFLPALDKNYILLRLDANGEHPYATVYHEYTHLLFSKVEDWLPLWLNEGLAEFYQNTDISEKTAILGQASRNDILWLRQNRLLPLTTLLTVDRRSPYYHEEQKGTIFYSESWALTHYLQITDKQDGTHRVNDYMALVANHVDSVAAATRAFGDLKQLQSKLEAYIEQARFTAFRLTKPLPVDDTTFTVQSIKLAQADAVRADFLAYDERAKDARTLLDQVLRDDPNSALAHETMGYLAFRQGQVDEARKWYEQAVKLDSQSYLAHYYFAAMSMNAGAMSADTEAQVEASLRTAIKLNPSFAPTYDRLAVFYGMRRKNLDEAHMLNLQAVQLDPGYVGYRINTANTLLIMQRESDAMAVLQNALPVAKTPEDVLAVQNLMEDVQHSLSARREVEEQNLKIKEQMEAELSKKPASGDDTSDQAAVATPPPHEEVLRGPHVLERGTLKHVRCTSPAILDVDLDTGDHAIALHAANYYKITFYSLHAMPKPDLNPCKGLEGTRARVEFVAASGKAKAGGIVAIELLQ
jgi:Tfp pilus assembly protein PilF